MVEQIYYVDEHDEPTGEVSEKLAAHTSNTRLHAAFSCYIFNKHGELLVTKRAAAKKVWPSVWTNSCCGHPQPGESREDAIKRRVQYELGMKITSIKLLVPKYVYKTPPYNGIIEHEYCPIYLASAVTEPTPNPSEVEDYKWVSWQWFLEETAVDSNDYSDLLSDTAPKWSWWCKDQLKHLPNIPYKL